MNGRLCVCVYRSLSLSSSNSTFRMNKFFLKRKGKFEEADKAVFIECLVYIRDQGRNVDKLHTSELEGQKFVF